MSDPEDTYGDEALAGEYVLRLLEPQERATFEARLPQEAELRGLVWEWEAQFAALAANLPEAAPPRSLRATVLNAAGGTPARKRVGLFWSAVLGGLAAAAVALVMVFGNPFATPDLRPAFQAELISADGGLVLTAGVIPATHEIVIQRTAGAAPAGGVRELWLIAEGASTPVSLGLLSASGSTTIVVPDDIAPGVRTGTIAISEEPEGGSPTGAPTGPIVATAQFTDL